MRSLWPCSDSRQPPAFPRHSNGRRGFPGPTEEEACNPCRHSRIPPQIEKKHPGHEETARPSCPRPQKARASTPGLAGLHTSCSLRVGVPPREDRDPGVALQSPPWSQASPRGEAKDPALLLSRHRCLLEPTEWPKGSHKAQRVEPQKNPLHQVSATSPL